MRSDCRIDRAQPYSHCQRQCRCYTALMAVMLSKTYEAFKAAGAPEDQAREAAEEIAAFDNRLTRLEVMLAIVLAGVLSLVIKAFLP